MGSPSGGARSFHGLQSPKRKKKKKDSIGKKRERSEAGERKTGIRRSPQRCANSVHMYINLYL